MVMRTQTNSAIAASGLDMCCLATGAQKIACQYGQYNLAPFMYCSPEAVTLLLSFIFVSVQTFAVPPPWKHCHRLPNVTEAFSPPPRRTEFNPTLIQMSSLLSRRRPSMQSRIRRLDLGRSPEEGGPAAASFCGHVVRSASHPGDVCEFIWNESPVSPSSLLHPSVMAQNETTDWVRCTYNTCFLSVLLQ